MDEESVMAYVLANLTVNELKIVMSAVNTYGDGQHPVLTKENFTNLKPVYAVHCLGRQYGNVIKAGMMVSQPHDDHIRLHQAHDSIMDTFKDAFEFASVPETT